MRRRDYFEFRIACETGFSLVELLVVVVIIGFISSIMVMSASGVSKRRQMMMAVGTLAHDLERLQSIAATEMHKTRLVRQSGGYRCYDDNNPAGSINVTRVFPTLVSWAPSCELAVGSTIIFNKRMTPLTDSFVLLTDAANDLKLWTGSDDIKTVSIEPVVGLIQVSR